MDVRPVETSDVEAVLRLLKQLGYDMRPDVVTTKIRRLETAQLDAAFVAVADQIIVGFVSVHAHDLFHTSGRLGRIVALVVDEGTRGSRIGDALVSRAETFFRSVGCARVEVTSAAERTGAHSFYRALGFANGMTHLVKPL